MDWNQYFVIDCSLSHPAGHKPFTCSHSVLRTTWLNIHAVRWMRFSARLSVHVFTTLRNLTWSLFVSSVVSELLSDWSINCFLRYVCFCIMVKDKSLFVLMVERCCRFASLKPARNHRRGCNSGNMKIFWLHISTLPGFTFSTLTMTTKLRLLKSLRLPWNSSFWCVKNG